MKFVFVLTLITLLMGQRESLSVELKPSFTESRRSRMLMKLKMLQMNFKQTSFLGTSDITLHQQILAEKRLATYYGEIGIGYDPKDPGKSQMFKMLFDTGSCHFWVPGENCTTSRCLSHHKYQMTSDLVVIDGSGLEISYLSGKVEGYLGNETVLIGDIVVKRQTVGIADEVNIPLLDDVEWDGIVGLSYPNNKIKNQHVDPLFDNIIKQNLLTSQGLNNVFGYVLSHQAGSLSFGQAHQDHYKGNFLYSQVIEHKYWTISLLDVQKIPKSNLNKEPIPSYIYQKDTNFNDIKLCPQGCKAIIDTGTYLIYGPQTQINNYFGDLVLETCEQKKDLPDLLFEFEAIPLPGAPSQARQSLFMRITPQEYVLEFTIDGKDDCVMGISPDQDDSEWTLGQLFLKRFYTLFDRENNTMGFAESTFNEDATQIISPINTQPIKQQQQLPEPIKQQQQLPEKQNLINNFVSNNVQVTDKKQNEIPFNGAISESLEKQMKNNNDMNRFMNQQQFPVQQENKIEQQQRNYQPVVTESTNSNDQQNQIDDIQNFSQSLIQNNIMQQKLQGNQNGNSEISNKFLTKQPLINQQQQQQIMNNVFSDGPVQDNQEQTSDFNFQQNQ